MSSSLHGQESDSSWFNYPVDTMVFSVMLPGSVYEMDTVILDVKSYQIYSDHNGARFMAQRVLRSEGSSDGSFPGLPHDHYTLIEDYNEFLAGMSEKVKYSPTSKHEHQRNGYIGYKVIYEDTTGNKYLEMEMYLLNNYLYNFYYIKQSSFIEADKDSFFNSIKMKNGADQYVGTSMGRLAARFTVKVLIPISIIIFLIIKLRRRNKK